MALDELRAGIDRADQELSAAFVRRMEIAARIAAYKRENGLPVLDQRREDAVAARMAAGCDARLAPYMERLYRTLFALSREYQQSLLARTGLIGHPLGHSCSPQLHSLYGDTGYQLWDITPDELPYFMQKRDFALANVTIPYKQAVLPDCDTLSDTARRIGSVNTLICRDGRVHGDNTDAYGFAALARRTGVDFSQGKTLILGSGGTSRTARYVVESAGGEAVIVSRTGENNYQNLSRHADARWIVNATPVGMYPNVDGCLLNLSDFPALSGVLDVVYNPLRTPLIQQAQALKIPAMGGLYMLCAQAARARELLTGTLPDADAAYQALLRQRLGVALIGMPGAGKSTLARRLAQLLPLELHDTDDEIAQSAGQTIPDLFKAQGEAAFRALESQAVAQAGSQGGRVIAAEPRCGRTTAATSGRTAWWCGCSAICSRCRWPGGPSPKAAPACRRYTISARICTPPARISPYPTKAALKTVRAKSPHAIRRPLQPPRLPHLRLDLHHNVRLAVAVMPAIGVPLIQGGKAPRGHAAKAQRVAIHALQLVHQAADFGL